MKTLNSKQIVITAIICIAVTLLLFSCGGNSSKSVKGTQNSDIADSLSNQDGTNKNISDIVAAKIKRYYTINNYLDNYAIASMNADTALFNSDNVYKVIHYNLGEGNRKELLSETRYLPDGRIHEKKEYSAGEEIRTHIKNYYDKNFNKLILREWIQYEYERQLYSWLYYDNNLNLTEELSYETSGKNNINFDSYTTYNYEFNSKDTVVKIAEIGYDTIAGAVKTYTFAYPYLTESSSESQSNSRKYKFINWHYSPLEIKGYVFDDRNVYFKYDDKGYVKSEVWYQPEGRLENKTEYSYSDNYKERIEQRYQRLGTEKAVKIIRKFNDLNDLLFEQHIYPDYPSGVKEIEYTYDDKGNWVYKQEYYTEYNKGIPGERKLVKHELREIEYYTPEQVVKGFATLPDFPKQLEKFRKNIPEQATKKQINIDEFNNAVETGNFDSEIKLQSADNISDFTPEYWTVSGTAYGDLDGVEGDEAVVVYLTPVGGEMSFAHCLAIFKKEEGKWKLWHQTFSPVLDSGSGGMMGNPFNGISIDKRAIVVNHFGGSRQKWEYTHRYRYQNNNWYLIGAMSSYGASCEYYTVLDYNLSTGDIVVTRTYDECEDNEMYAGGSWTEKFTVKRDLPLMEDFIPGNTEVKVPNRDTEMYY